MVCTHPTLVWCLIAVIHNNSLIGCGQWCGAHTIWANAAGLCALIAQFVAARCPWGAAAARTGAKHPLTWRMRWARQAHQHQCRIAFIHLIVVAHRIQINIAVLWVRWTTFAWATIKGQTEQAQLEKLNRNSTKYIVFSFNNNHKQKKVYLKKCSENGQLLSLGKNQLFRCPRTQRCGGTQLHGLHVNIF